MNNMAKFQKMEYYNKKENTLKIYSYSLAIPKAIVEAAELQNKELSIGIKNGKIIIEEKVKN